MLCLYIKAEDDIQLERERKREREYNECSIHYIYIDWLSHFTLHKQRNDFKNTELITPGL